MSHRTPSEQAVIQALQAVANYPESRDFVETIYRRLPGLQTLIDTPTQLEGCLTTTREPVPNTSAATRALSPVLTQNAGLTDPIGELTIDTDAETAIPSPIRKRLCEGCLPPREISPRSRNESAAQ